MSIRYAGIYAGPSRMSRAANGTSIVKMQPRPGILRTVDFPAMRSDGLPGDRKTETEPGAIGPASLAEGLEQIRFAFGNAAALVFYLDEQALASHGRGGSRRRLGRCT